MNPPPTALVTGATGFLGSHVCRALAARGGRVRALRRSTSRLTALEGLRLELVTGDLLEPDSLAHAMRGVDVVFHVAAESAYWRNPGEVLRAAVVGTHNVIEAALRAGVRKVVLTSSVAALGVPARGELLTESHTFNLPQSEFPYGYAKRQSELTALRLAEGQLHLVIVNPSIVLGPGDVNRISGSILIETARGLSFAYNGGGVNVVHIDDVAEGHLAAAERGRAGERYILGGENVTHRQMLTEAARIAGRRPPWLRIPNAAVPPLAALVDFAGRFMTTPLNGAQLRMSRHRLWVDTSRARHELALPEPKPFSLATQDAYDWYRAEGVI
jgi:dihydroflavonol-4-reductase